jgi:hypothetical protein
MVGAGICISAWACEIPTAVAVIKAIEARFANIANVIPTKHWGGSDINHRGIRAGVVSIRRSKTEIIGTLGLEIMHSACWLVGRADGGPCALILGHLECIVLDRGSSIVGRRHPYDRNCTSIERTVIGRDRSGWGGNSRGDITTCAG